MKSITAKLFFLSFYYTGQRRYDEYLGTAMDTRADMSSCFCVGRDFCSRPLDPRHSGADVLSLLELRVFINLHVSLRKRIYKTEGMQTQELRNESEIIVIKI